MRISDVVRHEFSIFAISATLAGCGAPGPSPQSRVAQTAANRSGSWMTPQRKGHKSVLMYAGGVYGNVYIYDYFTGKQVGKLSGISGIYGMCVDAKGDVYMGQSDNTTLEYAHGGTKILNTYTTDGTPSGCSVDAKNDVAITRLSPGSVTVFMGGDPSKSKTYSDPDCESQSKMGYDANGNLIGLGEKNTPVSVCALPAGSKSEKTFSISGFTINVPGGTLWDGKYFALTDQNAGGNQTDGIIEASLSGTTVTSHGETILTDTCNFKHTDITQPFILGEKNTPVNDRQGKVLVGINSWCTSSGNYVIEFWHYPNGGNPFKVYKFKIPLGGVGAISIGSLDSSR